METKDLEHNVRTEQNTENLHTENEAVSTWFLLACCCESTLTRSRIRCYLTGWNKIVSMDFEELNVGELNVFNIISSHLIHCCSNGDRSIKGKQQWQASVIFFAESWGGVRSIDERLAFNPVSTWTCDRREVNITSVSASTDLVRPV